MKKHSVEAIYAINMRRSAEIIAEIGEILEACATYEGPIRSGHAAQSRDLRDELEDLLLALTTPGAAPAETPQASATDGMRPGRLRLVDGRGQAARTN